MNLIRIFGASAALNRALFILTFIAIIHVISCYPRHEICIPQDCPEDTNYLYYECCGNRCCQRWRIWVMPALVASAAFTMGVFFALCFQCR